MFIYTTFGLILSTTLVVTSSVNKSGTDGLSRDNHDVSLADEQSSHTPASSETTLRKMTGEHVDGHDFHSPMMVEGGPIYQLHSKNSSSDLRKSPSSLVTLNETAQEILDESPIDASESKLPKTRNASVVARKGAVPSPKITARKGVGPETLPMMESTTEVMDEAVAQVVTQKTNINEQKISSSIVRTMDDAKKKIVENKTSSEYSKITISSNIKNNNASTVTANEMEKSTTLLTTIKLNPTAVTKSLNHVSTTSSPSTKKFKAKPTVTIGEMDADKPIPASPTKTPPLGMPRKIDYIVPVIITIMALPFLGVATLFLYRRGRDCWDKRHYRRMDFLIDGMYNDYSWK